MGTRSFFLFSREKGWEISSESAPCSIMFIILLLSSHWKSKIRDWAKATKQNINNQPTWLNKLIKFLASWDRPTETTSKTNSKTIIMHFYIQGEKKITVKITPNGNFNAYFRFLVKNKAKKHEKIRLLHFEYVNKICIRML